ncbi:MAG TPA: GH25 family lysozyme [Verrucomicrobiae bacterium]|nr:GH25 family lysozyme [Verrucomicrobiae bacterium]
MSINKDWNRITCWQEPNVAKRIAVLLSCALFATGTTATAQVPRALGIDVSAWQGNLSTTTWATFARPTDQQVGGIFGDGRSFVFIRATRGGTTGEDHRQGGYAAGNNTFYNLSQRYDDPYFVQNINRATAAGMFAGPYHFNRADIIETTSNSDGSVVGVANTGTDEADHMIQMAGAWMRPGYMLPVLDLEAGASQHSVASLSAWAVAFSDRIYQQTGIRPMVYANSSYVNSEVNSTVPASMPYLWIARPTSDDPLTTEPPPALPTYPNVYGVWNPTYPNTPTPAPWKFWQYDTTGGLNGYGGNLDKDAANGGIEFVKDFLVPAIWMNDASGDWGTLANWNSGLAPVAPISSPGQLTPIGTQILPAPRLPGAAGSGVTSGQHDTVVLDRPGGNVTVTLSSGAYNIRKLYMRETLNIVGGSLTINYTPSPDSTAYGAQFSGSVTLSNSGALSVHTLQVDTNRTFTLAGGTITFNKINLMPHASTPARILMNGDVTFNGLTNGTATVAKGAGTGTTGSIDLSGGTRTFTVGNTASDVDLSLEVPVTNGGLTKSGAGTLRLTSANTYAGGTTVSAGRLLVNNTTGSGTGSGIVSVDAGVLGGTGTIAGVVAVNSAGTISPGLSLGTLTLNSPPIFNGTNFMEINRNNGAPLADRITLTSGTLDYNGTLVVSNAGLALTGGESFTLFSAPGYSGAFATMILPGLDAELNWYTDSLVANGTIKVNRQPVAAPLWVTNVIPAVLDIPFTTLTGNASDADADSLALATLDLTTTNGIALTTNATSIIYTNPASGIDQFSYTLSDGHGGTASGQVNIVNVIANPSAEFVGVPNVTDGSVLLNFSAVPGWTYYLERSTNLATWKTIWTNVAPAGGVFDYTDNFNDLTEPPPSAFYKLRWEQ